MALESAFVGTTKDSFIEFGELKEVCEDVIILIKSSRWRLLISQIKKGLKSQKWWEVQLAPKEKVVGNLFKTEWDNCNFGP